MVMRSERKKQKRTKPDWYYHQIAVIPFRLKNNQTEILLITSIRKKKWIFPKGIVEKNNSPTESAANEAHEEAGVKGTVLTDLIGSYTVSKWGGVCNVQVYPMEVAKEHSNWPEDHVRERNWCSIDDALKCVSDIHLLRIIRQFETWFERYKKPLRKQ